MPSGRFLLRIDPGLHERLRALASRRGRSLNQLCADLLERGVEGSVAVPSRCEIARGLVSSALWEQIWKLVGEKLEGLVLFGSAARGEQWRDSDVDLLVVLRAGSPLKRDLYRDWDIASGHLEPGWPRTELHFVALPRSVASAGSLWFEVALEGVILHDPWLRVARFLISVREEIAAGRAVRKFVHGRPYWIRGARSA